MKGILRRAVRAAIVSVTLALPALPVDGCVWAAAAREEAVAAFHVAVEDRLLTVDVRGVPLGQVLGAINEQTALKLTVLGDVSAPVSYSFAAVPLGEGIQRLARGHSVALVYSPARGRSAPALTEVLIVGATGPPPAPSRVDVQERASRLRTVRELARRRDDTAAGELARIVAQDADAVVRSQAAAALGRMGGAHAVAALMRALADQASGVRIQAVRALRRIQGSAAVQALAGTLMGDRDPGVRRAAAQMLATLPAEVARAALEPAASDPDGIVRRVVARALARWQR